MGRSKLKSKPTCLSEHELSVHVWLCVDYFMLIPEYMARAREDDKNVRGQPPNSVSRCVCLNWLREKGRQLGQPQRLSEIMGTWRGGAREESGASMAALPSTMNI